MAERRIDVDDVTAGRGVVRTVAAAVGAVFLLVGVLGFVPGITTNFDQLAIAGRESGAELLGLFQVSVLHNVVHIAFGVFGLILARSVRGAIGFLVVGGAIYLLLWLYGTIIDLNSTNNFVPVNTADNVLHLVLGVVMVATGLVLLRIPRRG